MNKGWIKLHRQLLDCEIWVDDSEKFDRRSAWIDLLLLANHRDKDIIFDGKPLTIGRGQYVSSIRKLSARWGWGNQKTTDYLRLLCDLRMIEKDSDTRRTLITIVNYEVYQDTENEDGTQIDTVSERKRNANRTQIVHKQEYKELKNEKNEKNKEKEINKEKEVFGEYRNVKLTDAEYVRLADDYGEDLRHELIKYLDEYLEENPAYKKKTKNHNLTIRRWVVDAVKKKTPTNNSISKWANA